MKLKNSAKLICFLIILMLALVTLAACNSDTQAISEFEVTYIYNDGTNTEITKTVSKDSWYFVPYEREGYNFIGWTIDKNGLKELSENDEINSAKTLYAMWQKKRYKVRFYIGNYLISEEDVNYMGNASTPSTTSFARQIENGYVFTGWDSTDYLEVTKNVNIYAQTAKSSCRITFVEQDGAVIKYLDGMYGETVDFSNVKAKKIDGMVFRAWKDKNGFIDTTACTFEEDTTYTATYLLTIPEEPIVGGNTNITYGDNLSISLEDTVEYPSIEYSYAWYGQGNKLLSSNKELNISQLNAGDYNYTYRITASKSKYESTVYENDVQVSVEKAPLLATLSKQTITYGSSVPTTYDITYTGFKFDDDESIVNLSNAKSETNYKIGSSVGDYNLSVSNLASINYIILDNATKENKLTSSITVNKKAIHYQTNGDFIYSGSIVIQNVSRYITGLLEEQKIVGELSTTSANVGTYKTQDGNITSTIIVEDKNGNDLSHNYDLSISCIFVIQKATQSIDFSDKEFSFNGQEHNVNLDGKGATVLYSLEKDGEFTSSCPTFKEAGEYYVFFKATKENYIDLENSYKVVVNKAPLTIRANNLSIVFGSELVIPENNYSIDGELYGETLSISISSQYEKGKPVNGEYYLYVIVDGAKNFNLTKEPGKLTVTKAPLNIEVNNLSKLYGESVGEITYTINGAIAGFEPSIQTSTNYKIGDSVGEYTLNAFTLNSNYQATISPAVLTINPRPISLSIDNKNAVYGESAPQLTSSITSGEIYGTDDLLLEYLTDYQVGYAANQTFDITLSSGNSNYLVSYTKGILSVVKRNISIKIDDSSVVYGNEANLNSVGYSLIEGTIYGSDDIQILTTSLYVPGDTQAKAISAITLNTNYNLAVTDGTLSIEKRAITLSLEDTKAYDEAVYSKQYTNVALTGIFGSDKLNGTISTKSYLEGIYDSIDKFNILINIKQGDLDVTNLYDITYDISIEIVVMAINHILHEYEGIYDKESHSSSIEVTHEGTFTVEYSMDKVSYSTNLITFIDAGIYTVYYKITGQDNDGIDMTPTLGVITTTINKKAASITIVGDASTTYKDVASLASLTIQKDDIIDSDIASFEFTLITSYVAGNDAGNYDVNVSYTENDNYTLSITKGVLVVLPKEIDITTPEVDVTYGSEISFATLSSTDVDANKYISVLSSTYSIGNNIGTYTATINCTSENYTLLTSVITINCLQKDLLIKANDIKVKYGTSPVFTATFDSLYKDDTINVTYNCSGKNVGTYDIEVNYDDDTNYNISTKKGTLTIEKATLTGTISGASSITYGGDLPAYTVSFTGFMYDDDASIISGSAVFNCAYETEKVAKNYNVTVSNQSASNYELNYQPFTLSVAKASLSVSVNSHAPITYNDDVPTDFSLTAIGFKFDDDVSILNGITYTTTYTKGANASSTGYEYNINTSSITLTNYTIVKDSAKYLVVNKANYANITHRNLSGTYNPNNTLAAYQLDSYFSWINEATVPNCLNDKYAAKYNADTTNYNDFMLDVTLVLEKATTTITASNVVVNYTTSGYEVKTQVNGSHNNPEYSDEIIYSIENITVGGIYSITLSTIETDNYKAGSKVITFTIKAATISGVYYTVEDACTTGGTIVLVGDAFVSSSITIASKSTFYMYYDAKTGGTTLNSENLNAVQKYIDHEDIYKKLELTIKSGVTVTVDGTLAIGGITGTYANIFGGQTSGDFTQVNLEEGSNMIINGTLKCYGYIKGSGQITENNKSKTYAPFVMRDWQGGAATLGMYEDGRSLTSVALNNKASDTGICPFKQYEFPNIQVTRRVNYGATETGYCSLWTSSTGSCQTAEVPLISTSTAFLTMSSGSYIIITFEDLYDATKSNNADKFNHKITYNIYGTVTAGSMTVEISITGSALGNFVKGKIDTGQVVMAIPYLFNFNVYGTLVVGKEYKLMPGCKLTVMNGGTLNINKGGAITIYTGDFVDRNQNPAQTNYPSNKGDAILTNGGTINVASGGTLAGNVYGVNGGKIVVNSGATTSMTTTEGYGSMSGSSVLEYAFTLHVTATITKNLTLVNSDSSTISAGIGTYNYTSNKWA